MSWWVTGRPARRTGPELLGKRLNARLSSPFDEAVGSSGAPTAQRQSAQLLDAGRASMDEVPPALLWLMHESAEYGMSCSALQPLSRGQHGWIAALWVRPARAHARGAGARGPLCGAGPGCSRPALAPNARARRRRTATACRRPARRPPRTAGRPCRTPRQRATTFLRA